jgi:hypothetical protein
VTSTPDSVAEVIVYFLTGASVVTGETLLLDGGHHLTQMPNARRWRTRQPRVDRCGRTRSGAF